MKQLRLVIIVLAVLCGVLIYSYHVWPSVLNPSDKPQREISVGVEKVEQTFVAEHDGLESITLRFARTSANIAGEVRWVLLDETTNQQYQATVSIPVDYTGKTIVAKMPETINAAGHRLTFKVEQTTNVVLFKASDASGQAESMVMTLNYRRLHLETAVVLLGLLGYLVAFFYLLNRLFR